MEEKSFTDTSLVPRTVHSGMVGTQIFIDWLWIESILITMFIMFFISSKAQKNKELSDLVHHH